MALVPPAFTVWCLCYMEPSLKKQKIKVEPDLEPFVPAPPVVFDEYHPNLATARIKVEEVEEPEQPIVLSVEDCSSVQYLFTVPAPVPDPDIPVSISVIKFEPDV